MTIPKFKAIGRYWEQWPPLHKMIASYFGLGKPKPKIDATEEGAFDESMLAQLFNDVAAVNAKNG